tara:strand:- start:254 stop:682 length:429 start_codon:yes stop_codon:yes gene_type:complete
MAGPKSRMANLSAEVMKDVLDSFLNMAGKSEGKKLELPTSPEKIELYEKIGLEKPVPKTGELSFDRSWYNDPEEGYNLLAPPMTYEEFIKLRFNKHLVDVVNDPVQDELTDRAYNKYLNNLRTENSPPIPYEGTGSLGGLVD